MPLSLVPLVVLRAVAVGHRFGFDIMDAAGLPSGTVYPALRRLDALGLVRSSWENDAQARKGGRPRRRNYEVTRAGRLKLTQAEARVAAVSRLFGKRVQA